MSSMTRNEIIKAGAEKLIPLCIKAKKPIPDFLLVDNFDDEEIKKMLCYF